MGSVFFSVIVPAFNAEQSIIRCLQSILRQTFTNFEVIVINDGSTDDTLAKIQELDDERIKTINQTNQGVSEARNNGIRFSSGQFICFLDSDDEWFNCHLYELYNAIKSNNSCCFFGSLAKCELLNGEIVPEIELSKDKKPFFVDNAFKYERKNHYKKTFYTGCVCVKRMCFDKYGLFEKGIKVSEDVDMWNRIILFEGKVIVPYYTVLRHRDYSKATKEYPIGVPFLFNKRIPDYLRLESLSSEKKNELKWLYNTMLLTSARSYIVFGDKKESWKKFKKVKLTFVNKLKYMTTLISFAIPSFIIKKYFKKKEGKYYAEF